MTVAGAARKPIHETHIDTVILHGVEVTTGAPGEPGGDAELDV